MQRNNFVKKYPITFLTNTIPQVGGISRRLFSDNKTNPVMSKSISEQIDKFVQDLSLELDNKSKNIISDKIQVLINKTAKDTKLSINIYPEYIDTFVNGLSKSIDHKTKEKLTSQIQIILRKELKNKKPKQDENGSIILDVIGLGLNGLPV
ncbi:hypothetical protein H012_gp875 [Acanthamoeba polyphaga moumouvirus]|uniref:Uncharacterized protein n=2 Tax=Moumouvirus TaxID=3080801 RepID=L7RBS8_9VIRU|nr:hypothetical protein H012_gp875 [Acanthamoeba polyphaga moumouvirus]AEX63283.1 hypothetical protein mv_L1081 [Moumouvirus Monve]AGC01591.1 hypothetical protein Moumou_00043 [Acanthamoeba polyphaga moumouvirus]